MAADKTQPLELPRPPPRRAELKPVAWVNGTCYDRRGGRNPAGRNAGGAPSAYHFDVLLRQLDPLLAAEQRQQYQHALVWPLPGLQSELPLQPPSQDPHAIAEVRPRRFRQLHQSAPLPRSNLVDHAISDDCRRRPVEDQTRHVRAPPRRPPSSDDDNE